MAKVLLYTTSLEDPSVNELHCGAYERFVESAALDRFGIHTLTHDPEEADLIIFADVAGRDFLPRLLGITSTQRNLERSVLFLILAIFRCPFYPVCMLRLNASTTTQRARELGIICGALRIPILNINRPSRIRSIWHHFADRFPVILCGNNWHSCPMTVSM